MIVNRKCIITGKILPTSQLIRFVLNKDGSIKIETNQKLEGRGAYCIKDLNALEILFKKRMLNKSFRCNIPLETYNRLKEEVEQYVKKQK